MHQRPDAKTKRSCRHLRSLFDCSHFPLSEAKSVIRQSVPIDQATKRRKIIFAVPRARRNQKTPERMTIEKPLNFCRTEIVGQFASCEQDFQFMRRGSRQLSARRYAPCVIDANACDAMQRTNSS